MGQVEASTKSAFEPWSKVVVGGFSFWGHSDRLVHRRCMCAHAANPNISQSTDVHLKSDWWSIPAVMIYLQNWDLSDRLSHHRPWLHWFCDVPIPSLLFAESPMFIELGGQQKSQLEDNLREELSQALWAHVGPKGWVSLGSTVGWFQYAATLFLSQVNGPIPGWWWWISIDFNLTRGRFEPKNGTLVSIGQ